MTGDGVRVGVDFGTSSTAAVLAGPGAQSRPLLFDGSPLLPSAVFADADGGLLTGRDALHSARTQPERFEPAPKRCVDDGAVLLGDRAVPVAEMIAAVLRRVAAEAHQVAGEPVRRAVLTHPVSWGPVRRQTLLGAASTVFAEPALVTEPVAAASYFLTVAGRELPVGSTAMVYDLGAGTFDATVVRRNADGFDVLATGGLDNVGGLDIDAALVASLGEVYRPRDEAAWTRLLQPSTPADRRASRAFWDDVRVGKELLSRAPTAMLHVPILDDEALLGREQLERLAGPILERTVEVAARVLGEAGKVPGELAGLFLVGGASRMPLVATLLHRHFGVPPVLVDQPELVVASGSVHAPRSARTELSPPPPAAPAVAPPPAPAVAPPPVAHVLVPHQVYPPAGVGPRSSTGQDNARRRLLLLAVGVVAVLALLGYSVWSVVPWNRGATDLSGGPTPSATPSVSTTPVVLEPPAPTMLKMPADAKANSVVLSTDGQRVAAVGQYTIRIYTVPDLRPVGKQLTVGKETLRVASGPSEVYREDFGAATFSADGRLLATYDGGMFGYVQIWDVATGARVRRLSDAWWASCLAFSPKGDQFVACAGPDQSVRFWNVSGWNRPGRVSSDDPAVVQHVAFSPDGRLLATDGGKGRTLLWDAHSRKRLAVLQASEVPSGLVPVMDRGVPVAFSPDGGTMATGGADGTVRLWDVATRKQTAVLGTHGSGVVDVAFAADGTLASADPSDVWLWDVTARRQVGVVPSNWDRPSQREGLNFVPDSRSLSFTPDSRTLSVCHGDTIWRWDVGAVRAYGTPR